MYTEEGSCDPVDWFVEHNLVCLSRFTVSDTFSISSRLHQRAHVFVEHAGSQAEPAQIKLFDNPVCCITNKNYIIC